MSGNPVLYPSCVCDLSGKARQFVFCIVFTSDTFIYHANGQKIGWNADGHETLSKSKFLINL
jgi:hypothetical protein